MNCYPEDVPYQLQIVENPWHLGFSRETDTGEGGIRLGEIILDSLYEFMGDFCIPLTMDLSTWYWDEELDMPKGSGEVPGRPEPSGRLLRTTSRYARDFKTSWSSQAVSDASADVIDRDLALSFYRQTLDADMQLDPHADISWTEIQIRSTYVRLPKISDQFTSAYDHLRSLDHRGTAVLHPIEWRAGSAWFPGPLSDEINAPIEIRIYRYFGEVVMDVDIYNYAWDPDWPDSPGYADIAKGIVALERRGWVRK